MFNLQIDDREHALLDQFDDEEFEKIRLTIGDIAYWYYNRLIFLIERKTLEDFISSLTDGRLTSQVANMLRISKEKNGGFEPKRIIILETKFDIPKNVQAKLDHLTIRDNFHVIYTSSIKDTATRIRTLCDNCSQQFLTNFITDVKTDGGNPDEKTQDNKTIITSKIDTPIIDEVKSVLKALPRLGEEIATSILQQHTLTTFLTMISQNEHKHFKIGALRNRKLPPSISTNILLPAHQRKMIAEIKGMGKKSLELLLDSHLEQLFKTPTTEYISTLPIKSSLKDKLYIIFTTKITV
jgi:ERCC4-type nuclease